MLEKMKNLVVKEEGQGMVEYGLIIGLVALVAAVGLTALGGDLSTFFTNLKDKLTVAAGE